MSTMLIKASRAEDCNLYVVWSTVVDAPIKLGSKEQLLHKLTFWEMLKGTVTYGIHIDPNAFMVADETGSASIYGGEAWFSWDEEEPIFFSCCENGCMVPRENFEEFINVYIKYDLPGVDSSPPQVSAYLHSLPCNNA